MEVYKSITKWSGILLIISIIWFEIAFAIYISLFGYPVWIDTTTYIEHFNYYGHIAWVIPSWILCFCNMIYFTGLKRYGNEETRIWGELGSKFATIYATILSIHYYIQIFLLPRLISEGTLEYFSIFLLGGPIDIFGTLESFGYGIMHLGMGFAAFLFRKETKNRRIFWLLLLNGLSCIPTFFSPLLFQYDLFKYILIFATIIWTIGFPWSIILVIRKK